MINSSKNYNTNSKRYNPELEKGKSFIDKAKEGQFKSKGLEALKEAYRRWK